MQDYACKMEAKDFHKIKSPKATTHKPELPLLLKTDH